MLNGELCMASRSFELYANWQSTYPSSEGRQQVKHRQRLQGWVPDE